MLACLSIIKQVQTGTLDVELTMKVVVHWSGGKDCCTALHKVVEQGHEVACLVTYIYMEPYVFHSFKVIEQQAKALGHASPIRENHG